ncbi:MAG: SpoIIE family protein phosphatase [Clostridia bacterium]|nr:SpoIIE family protein phosphatase [Clostridia bacterium]
MGKGWKKYFEINISDWDSNRFYPMLTVMLAIFGMYLILSKDIFVYQMLRSADVVFIRNLLRMFEVITFFIVFYMCFISFLAYKKSTSELYMYTFLVVACLEAIFTIRFSKVVFSNPSETYTTLSSLILSIGLLVSALTNEHQRNHFRYSVIHRVILVAVMTLLMGILISSKPIYTYVAASTNFHIIKTILEFVIAITFATAAIFKVKQYYETQNYVFLSMGSGLMIYVFTVGFKMHFMDVSQSGLILPRLYSCIALLVIARALYVEEVSVPFEGVINAENQIKLYAENLEKIISKRTMEIKEVNTRLINELEYAKRIQQSLLPLKKLSFKNTIFMSEYFPCERLSGDFYDIYRIDDENIGMYVLDVSGHGISAALMTMFCNNYIKSTERLIKRYRGLKPHRNLRHFYEEFNKMNFPEEMHMVIFFASYNITTRVLTYCSGGMNCYPIVVKASGEAFYLDQSSGFPICKMSDFFTPEYVSARVELERGDRVVFYTDGLIDQYKNRTMDEEELIQLTKDYSDRPLKDLYSELKSRIDPLVENLEDDITYFIMEV